MHPWNLSGPLALSLLNKSLVPLLDSSNLKYQISNKSPDPVSLVQNTTHPGCRAAPLSRGVPPPSYRWRRRGVSKLELLKIRDSPDLYINNYSGCRQNLLAGTRLSKYNYNNDLK
jgi:hypothetical protein